MLTAEQLKKVQELATRLRSEIRLPVSKVVLFAEIGEGYAMPGLFFRDEKNQISTTPHAGSSSLTNYLIDFWNHWPQRENPHWSSMTLALDRNGFECKFYHVEGLGTRSMKNLRNEIIQNCFDGDIVDTSVKLD